jgi:hypothetical protein
MKLIGAAIQRTGTMSTQKALDILGLRAYHMVETARNFENGHLEMWNAAFEGTDPVDWQELFKDYQATTDNPACFFWKELMEAFPNAKVLLNVRDPERWCDSVLKILEIEDSLAKFRFLPRFDGVHRILVNAQMKFFGGDRSRDSLIASFKKYIEEVKATVPEERLLVYRVRDGWEPLCEFLGVPVPDIPFPHLNSSKEVDRVMGKIIIGYLVKDLLKLIWPYVLGLAVLIILLIVLL